ncbi:competence protein CglB [Lactococcus hodotermopsidis]|uniref:Competence protein CglB n=2 Tax=Pseudolactococcus hodotermopsidis TaxID=2709157 RepID=A0A6A0BCU5_9LACT|nr:competence protein CglB [Lactococcus hodotermopsidis]
MNNLFSSGFHLAEIVNFLGRSNLVEKEFVTTMREGLANGQNLSQILNDLKFSKSVVTQVALADFHGNTQQTLYLIEENLMKMQKVRQKLLSVATYPVILLAFLVLIMLGLKTYLLPQVESNNFAGKLIGYLPLLFLLFAFVGSLLALGIVRYLKRTSPLVNFQKLGNLPIIHAYLKLYFTAFYAREWGNLIKQGLEMRQILEIMKTQDNRFFREIGQDLLNAMRSGQEFHNKINNYRFFTPELALIVEYGEMKSKLGDELLIYSDESWEQFFEKVEKSMNLIQPLIFLFVALMIVLIYAAMLLPIYSQMDTAF